MWNVENGAGLIDPSTGQILPGVTRRYDPEDGKIMVSKVQTVQKLTSLLEVVARKPNTLHLWGI